MRHRHVIGTPFVALATLASAALGYACYPSVLPATSTDAGASNGSSIDGGTVSNYAVSPNARRIRRLTMQEYTNTLNDLLGTSANYGAVLPADPSTNGFDDDSDSLVVNQLFADEVRINAEQIATAYDTSTLGCSEDAGDSCAASFIASFGQRALRRPLTSAEVTAYTQLYDTVTAASDADTGIRSLIAAMLQSAGFLYKTELGNDATDGGTVPLTAWEIASELSYLFWRTMPDAELVAHAQAGDLVNPSVVASEVTRLLADPRANRMLDAFVDQWLGTNLLPYAEKDPANFPAYTPQVMADMTGEVHAFFENGVRSSNGTLSEMLTASYSYLTPNLASFYGVPFPEDAGESASEDAGEDASFMLTPMPSYRGGILTLGANLATQATPEAANPVRRGKVVREQFFCQLMPPPPSNVAAVVPPLDPNTANKATWIEHTTNPACSGCHNLMDPIGFGFDAFDAVGRLLPGSIDSTGDISGTAHTNLNFDGGVDLEQKLAVSPDVQSCFVTQWVRFGYGVSDTTGSVAEVTRVLGTFPSGAAGATAILQAITSGADFYGRASEPIPPYTPPDAGAVDAGPSAEDAGWD